MMANLDNSRFVATSTNQIDQNPKPLVAISDHTYTLVGLWQMVVCCVGCH